MDFLTAMDVSASGLTAQRARMNIIAMNLSNMHTTRTRTGGPYRRQMPVFATTTLAPGRDRRFRDRLEGQIMGVRVSDVVRDRRDFKLVFDPSHPDADQFGYVLMPNVNVIEEMVDMLTAKRSYEANVTALSAAKNMALKSLELLK